MSESNYKNNSNLKKEISQIEPAVIKIQIPAERMGLEIWKDSEFIKKIVSKTDTKIEIRENEIHISGPNETACLMAKEMLETPIDILKPSEKWKVILPKVYEEDLKKNPEVNTIMEKVKINYNYSGTAKLFGKYENMLKKNIVKHLDKIIFTIETNELKNGKSNNETSKKSLESELSNKFKELKDKILTGKYRGCTLNNCLTFLSGKEKFINKDLSTQTMCEILTGLRGILGREKLISFMDPKTDRTRQIKMIMKDIAKVEEILRKF